MLSFMSYIFFNIFYGFCTYLLIVQLCAIRVGLSKTKLNKMRLLCLLLFVATIVFNLYRLAQGGDRISFRLPNYVDYMIVCAGLILVATKPQRLKMLYCCIFGYTLILLIDSFFQLSNIWINWFQYMPIYILCKIVLLSICAYMCKYLFKEDYHYRTADWSIFSFLAFIVCAYLYVVQAFFPKINFSDPISFIYLYVFSMTFLILIYFIFYMYFVNLGKRNQSLHEVEYQLDNQKQQRQLLEELKKANEENRKLRHDLKHHFQSLEYMVKKDPDKAVDYLKELNEHVEAVKVVTTSNQILDYVVNSKLAICTNEGIDFIYEVQDSLHQLKDFDLISLLSNALDNAIEAQKYVDKKYVHCAIYDRVNASLLHIENTCDPSVIKKENNQFCTIKEDKERHGIGLSRIKTIAESYHGYTSIDVDDQYFDLKVWIPKDKKHKYIKENRA